MWLIDVILKDDGLPISSVEVGSKREAEELEPSISRNINHALYETRLRPAESVFQHYFCPECGTNWKLEDHNGTESLCFLCKTPQLPKFSMVGDR